MALKLTPPANDGSSGAFDLERIKSEVLAKLDLKREYQELGVKFTDRSWPDKRNGGTKHECYGPDRESEQSSTPSAVLCSSGKIIDSGSTEKPLPFFDFAMKAQPSKFGSFIETLRYYAEKAGVAMPGVKAQRGGKFLERSFHYHEFNGMEVYRVFRYKLPNGAKDFRQYPIKDDGSIDYKSGMDSVSWVPWKFWEQRSCTNGETIFVTEGEVAAEAVQSLGLVATTSHGGGGMAVKVWPKIADCFSTLNVVVLPDNDAKGQQYAEIVCQNLSGVAASVRVLRLPGLPFKGDAVEWVESGGTKEELIRLAAAAPLWTLGASPEPLPALAVDSSESAQRDATLADLRLTLAEDAWLWKGWISSEAVCLFAAEPGIGKTRLIMDLHRRLIHNLPWPDGSPTPTLIDPKVLWVVADNQHSQLCQIAEEFGIPDHLVIINSGVDDPYGGTSLETANQIIDFEDRAKRNSIVFASIDTIQNTADYKNQDSVDSKRQYKPLQEICARLKIPIFCVTHLNASGKALGKRALGQCRTVIYMTQPDPENQENRRKLWIEKSWSSKPQPLGATLVEGGYDYDDDPPVPPDDDRKVKGKGPSPDKLEAAKEWLTGYVRSSLVPVGVCRKAWEHAGFSTRTMYRAFEELGGIEGKNSLGNGKVWSLPLKDKENA